MFRIIYALFLVTFLYILPLNGQNVFLQEYLDNSRVTATDIFYSKFNQHSKLINGRLYQKKYPGKKGHQFYGPNNWAQSYLIISDEVFSKINLRYDIYNNEIVFNYISASGVQNLSLNKNRIKGFDLGGQYFMNIDFFLDQHEFNRNQFFEVKVNGQAKYLILWSKYLSKTSAAFSSEFIQESTRYILVNNSITEIKNKKSVLLALQDKEMQIRDFMKKSHILIKLSTDEQIEGIINYYNSL